MWPIRLLCSTLAIMLVGCATTRYAAERPDISSNCMSSLSQVEAIPLAYAAQDDEPKPVEFARLAKCYRSAEAGSVPVALYRFDGVTPPAEVSIAVLLSEGGTLAAAVEVLDGDMRPLQRYGFERFVRRGSQYSLNVFLNSKEGMPAYLLLSPDQEHVGKNDTIVGSATTTAAIPAGPVMFMYHSGNETNTVRPFLDGGKVLVVAKPQSQAPFSNK